MAVGMGLEHLFSGLVQGVGETKLALEKDKRDREDRKETEKLQTLQNLLVLPGLKPEQRTALFNMALEVASKGDKKVMDGMSSIIGPLLNGGGQQQASGQTGGVRPEPATPPQGQQTPQQPEAEPKPLPGSAGLPKLGSSGSGGGASPGLFYTPEEETQQAAQRAGAVARATGEVDVETYKQKLAAEFQLQKQAGFKLTGFTEPDPRTGLVTPVYTNDLTQQMKYGSPVDPFTSLEAGKAIEVNKAQLAMARKEGVDAILRGQGKDPASATPAERTKAEQAYAKTILDEQQTDINAKKAGAFRDIAAGTAALDKSLEREQLDVQKQALEENRQRDDYDRKSQQIQALVKQVEDSKKEASEAFNQAMVIKNYLESQGLDPNGATNPDDPEAVKMGYTPGNYQLLMGQAKAALGNARSIAQSATSHFKGEVEAGNLDEKPGQWPYIKDIRQPFRYTAPAGSAGFAPMPTPSNVSEPPPVSPSLKPKTPSGGRKSSQIDVPQSLLDELYKP